MKCVGPNRCQCLGARKIDGRHPRAIMERLIADLHDARIDNDRCLGGQAARFFIAINARRVTRVDVDLGSKRGDRRGADLRVRTSDR